MPYKKLIFLILLSTFSLSCSDDNSGNPNVEIDKKALLVNYADNLIIPAFEDLYTKSNTLNERFIELKAEYNEQNFNKVKQTFYDLLNIL